MKFDKFVNMAFSMWKNSLLNDLPQQTVAILGPPGIGKTSAARELAKKMQAAVESDEAFIGKVNTKNNAVSRVLDLSSMLPEDLNGLPYKVEHNGNLITKFAPHQWLFELCEDGAYGVLCLDDLPAAAPAMQVAARQISLERRVHDHRLSPGIFIIVTGNRRCDKAAATNLPSHFVNSVVMTEIEPHAESWHKWLASQPGANLAVSAYLRYKPSNFSKTPSQADKRNVFPSPRTWAKFSIMLDSAISTDSVMDLGSGLVSEGVAVEFTQFLKIYDELTNAEDVLADPKKAVPNPKEFAKKIDRMYAMITALGEVTGKKVRDLSAKKSNFKACMELLDSYLKALAWICQDQKEYIAASISTMYGVSNAMAPGYLILAAKNLKKNAQSEHFNALLKFLNEV